MENKLKTPVEQYEEETGLSAWRVKNMYYAEEYVAWLKNWLKKENSLAINTFKEWKKQLSDGK